MQKNYNSAPAKKVNYDSEDHLQKLSQEKNISKLVVVKNSELTIWKNLKKGDEAALGDLYNLYIDSLFSFGIQNSQDRGYVMDCIHDLFLDLYKYRKNLSVTDNVKYYLFKSLKRKINKKYKRKIIPVSEEFKYSINEDHKNYTKSHEEQIIINERTSEKHAKLEHVLCNLTEKQRKVLFLRYNQERTYDEISQIMRVSIQTARTMTYRAIKVSRKYMLNN
ncbi:MAG: RNA polymerase sigma-70 factor (ECF subfamily) [Paraglaciecola sp.]|jgi:RNA polymerase sigma-70 factor (ECF subfamily)|uniref:RNA polymerase sigma factor n=1 Tax=Polaribacter sp. TaxID=1920175 RepID=UPI003AC71452